jgi:hypothetical protein
MGAPRVLDIDSATLGDFDSPLHFVLEIPFVEIPTEDPQRSDLIAFVHFTGWDFTKITVAACGDNVETRSRRNMKTAPSSLVWPRLLELPPDKLNVVYLDLNPSNKWNLRSGLGNRPFKLEDSLSTLDRPGPSVHRPRERQFFR